MSWKVLVSALAAMVTAPAVAAAAQEKPMAQTIERKTCTAPDGVTIVYSAASARRLTVPLRAINGDIYPTDIAEVRKVKADFSAVIMKHMGHYPMLERPAEFDRLVMEVARVLQVPK